MKTKTKLLGLKQIEIDKEVYPRISVDWVTSARYYNALKSGADFPPIVVAKLDHRYLLVDGAHRLQAFKNNKEEHIQAEVLEGLDKPEIYKMAVKLNSQHGRQFSSQEVTQIISKLEELGVDEGIISELVGIPTDKLKPFVAKRITRVTETQDLIALKAPFRHLAGIEQEAEPEMDRFNAKSQIQVLDMAISLIENDYLNRTSEVTMEKLKKLKTLLDGYSFE